MPLAWKVEETCPRCGDKKDVWKFEKAEGAVTKECSICKACGCEWSEMRKN